METESTRSAESSDAPKPIGVAVVGDSPEAIFHLESAAIHPDLQAVCAAVAGEPADREAIPGCPFVEIGSLPELENIELVVVTGHPADAARCAKALLESGQHVVVDPDASLSSESIASLDSCAETHRCYCQIWRPYAADENWRQARQLVSSSEAGAVQSARFLLHDLAVSMMPAADVRPGNEIAHGVLATFGSHYVAQLLALVEGPVVRVRGQQIFRTLRFGDDDSKSATETDTGFIALIEFASGATGVVDVDLCSAAPLETGWVLQCERGGIARGQQSITVEDGEIYHVSVNVEPIDLHTDVVTTLRDWESNETCAANEGLRREVRVSTILELIRESHDSRRVVACNA